MKKRKLGIIFGVVAVILAITIIFTSSPIKAKTVRAGAFTSVYPESAGDAYHKADRNAFELVCKSGLIELYLDKSTSAVGILDTSADVFWSSIPTTGEEKSLSFSPLEIVLSDGSDKEYVLNSQDNSVAFNNASIETVPTGVNIKYSLSLDEESGKADINALKDTVRADVTVSYTLSDGSFYASVSMNNVHLPKGIFLEKLRLMNSFGAFSDSSADDFLLIPDGPGAIIKTGVDDPDFSPVSLSVYGSDPAKKQDKPSAVLGAYGIKHGNGAFLCIIESGETVADINAYRNSENSLNSVGAEFSVTDRSVEQKRSTQVKSLGYMYGGEMRLCYRFLSGKSATYSGMATACRENLIRNSVISSKVVSPSPYLPLILNLQFASIEKNSKVARSTFNGAQTLLSLLKAKGVNTVYVTAHGLFKKVDNGDIEDFGKLSNLIGSKNDYNDFYSYIKTQNFPLYIDTPVLTQSSSKSGGAKNITGSVMTFETSNGIMKSTVSKRQYINSNKLEDKVDELLYNSSSFSFDGYALSDIGTALYSDYSSDFYSRENIKKEISDQTSVLASFKPVMVTKGNFYAIKNASIISELPGAACAKAPCDAYVTIPFIPLILHGTYDYSIDSINTADDPNTAFLKTVEYGALPAASYHCSPSDANDKYAYNNSINDIVAYSVKANDILSDLRSARMTSHSEVQSGVICTEYNNSTKVYVNYTNEAVTVNGITIPPLDCVKVG